MAQFPDIPTAANGRVLTAVQANATSPRTFPNLSSLTKNPGDLLMAIVVAYQSSSGAGAPGGTVFSAWGASFTEFCDQMTTNSSTMAIGAAYKWSDGTETGTFTVAQAATITGHAGMILLSIPHVHPSTAPECGTIANGTSAAANQGALAPSWGAADTLWIAVRACGETSTAGSFTALSTPPANYSDSAQTGISQDVVGGVEGGTSFRQLNTASEDVGAGTCDTSNARNSALTIAVRPDAITILEPGYVNFQDPGIY